MGGGVGIKGGTLEWKILRGGINLEKKTSMAGMDIFWNHSLNVLNVMLYKVYFKRDIKENQL